MVNVFDAVRRGYNELEIASNQDIITYFDTVEQELLAGHISNLKGIYFEQVYVNLLQEQGISASLFAATNHSVVDIFIEGNELLGEFQLKATDSVSYINDTLEANPDIPIIATTEVAKQFDTEMVIDSGISNEAITNVVTEEIVGEYINPISPLSLIGIFFGLC